MSDPAIVSLSAPRSPNLAPARADPVKLLQFLTVFAIGGTETQVLKLVRGLDPSRFEVHFACLKRWGEFLESIVASGRPLTEYPIESLYGGHTLWLQLQFARHLRRDGIDLVHTYGFYPNVFAVPAARLAGVAVVASIRDTGEHLTPAQRRVQRLTCRLADRVLVNSEAVRQRLAEEGYAPGRITVIVNGLDLASFGGGRASDHIRRELGLPKDAPLVAVFSRISPVKGIEYFLEAAAMVSARFPEARFLMVGQERILRDGVVVETAYQRELQAYAARLGLAERVVFTGFRLDVPELLAEVAVSVLPSLSEGLSNTVLESMAAGVPVVATAVGGNPEAVQNGVSGLLVPPRDAAALARAIGALLADRDLAGRLARAARQRVSERFSEQRMVRQTERLYLGLLANKKPRRARWEREEGTA